MENNEAFTNLAIAIVQQAVEDYKEEPTEYNEECIKGCLLNLFSFLPEETEVFMQKARKQMEEGK